MNSVNLIGRLVGDPEVKTTSGSNPVKIAGYTLAVQRKFTRNNEADFIRCKAFGKQADFTEKYLKKGQLIGVSGHIQTGSYTNRDGNKVYTTDVIVDNHTFCQSKKEAESEQADSGSNQEQPQEQAQTNDGFMDIPDNIDEELPFA